MYIYFLIIIFFIAAYYIYNTFYYKRKSDRLSKAKTLLLKLKSNNKFGVSSDIDESDKQEAIDFINTSINDIKLDLNYISSDYNNILSKINSLVPFMKIITINMDNALLDITINGNLNDKLTELFVPYDTIEELNSTLKQNISDFTNWKQILNSKQKVVNDTINTVTQSLKSIDINNPDNIDIQINNATDIVNKLKEDLSLEQYNIEYDTSDINRYACFAYTSLINKYIAIMNSYYKNIILTANIPTKDYGLDILKTVIAIGTFMNSVDTQLQKVSVTTSDVLSRYTFEKDIDIMSNNMLLGLQNVMSLFKNYKQYAQLFNTNYSDYIKIKPYLSVLDTSYSYSNIVNEPLSRINNYNTVVTGSLINNVSIIHESLISLVNTVTQDASYTSITFDNTSILNILNTAKCSSDYCINIANNPVKTSLLGSITQLTELYNNYNNTYKDVLTQLNQTKSYSGKVGTSPDVSQYLLIVINAANVVLPVIDMAITNYINTYPIFTQLKQFCDSILTQSLNNYKLFVSYYNNYVGIMSATDKTLYQSLVDKLNNINVSSVVTINMAPLVSISTTSAIPIDTKDYTIIDNIINTRINDLLSVHNYSVTIKSSFDNYINVMNTMNSAMNDMLKIADNKDYIPAASDINNKLSPFRIYNINQGILYPDGYKCAVKSVLPINGINNVVNFNYDFGCNKSSTLKFKIIPNDINNNDYIFINRDNITQCLGSNGFGQPVSLMDCANNINKTLWTLKNPYIDETDLSAIRAPLYSGNIPVVYSGLDYKPPLDADNDSKIPMFINDTLIAPTLLFNT